MDGALLVSLVDLNHALGGAAAAYTLVSDEADDLARRRIQTKKGQGWRRHPASVLRAALVHEMGGNMSKARAWLEFTHAGAQWAQQQCLVYPSIARDPSLLWRPLVEGADPCASHGRPLAVDVLDEWTRVLEDGGARRGDIGDAGGDDQAAMLYWEDGRSMGGDADAALRINLDEAFKGIVAEATIV
jgi:hypothetical protein